jgi:hypothetical protein
MQCHSSNIELIDTALVKRKKDIAFLLRDGPLSSKFLIDAPKVASLRIKKMGACPKILLILFALPSRAGKPTPPKSAPTTRHPASASLVPTALLE